MLSTLLLTIAPLQSVTPARLDVRVIGVELSKEGLEWIEVGVPEQAVQADVASGEVAGVGNQVVPLGTYDFVRVSLGTVMSYETDDPCGGGGPLVGQVDWTGDPQIDPDGNRRWELTYTTFEDGGRASGDGGPDAPLLLQEPIRVEKGKNVPLRLIVGVDGLVRCDGGIVTVDRPSAELSVARSNATELLASQIWQVVGARLVDEGEGPMLATFRGELAFTPDGRWTAPQLSERLLTLASGEEIAGVEPWGGWWSATEEGAVWMTRTGARPALRGWVDRDLQVLTLASTGAGEEAFLMWGIRRGVDPPEQPYEAGARMVLHDHGLEVTGEEPLTADRTAWRVFTRFTGNWGYAMVDETTQRNTALLSGWIGAEAPAWPEVTSDWIPLHFGITWSANGPELALNQQDLGVAYEGFLSPDASLAILDRRGPAAGRVGLGLTMKLAEELENSSVQGLEFRGAFLEDDVLGFDHRYSSGTLTLAFTSGVSCLVTTIHSGPERHEKRTVPGTFECWGEGRLVVHLADGRRYEGQVEPGLRSVILTSAEENGLGGEDRMIGLLVRP